MIWLSQRRVDPQIAVGLLVDRTGFPLEIACFDGGKAETKTIIPVIKAFQDRHGVADMVIVADAGMLSADNLKAIDEAGLRFIVGSRMTKAPHDLAKHFHWHGNAFRDGQIIDTITMQRTAHPIPTGSRPAPGLKGYVTNITATIMPAVGVIASHHDLWHLEQSFRMSKSDLAARPIYHRKDSIEAHLTIVFPALAIARDLQARAAAGR